jgi:hypothetical protein
MNARLAVSSYFLKTIYYARIPVYSDFSESVVKGDSWAINVLGRPYIRKKKKDFLRKYLSKCSSGQEPATLRKWARKRTSSSPEVKRES